MNFGLCASLEIASHVGVQTIPINITFYSTSSNCHISKTSIFQFALLKRQFQIWKKKSFGHQTILIEDSKQARMK